MQDLHEYQIPSVDGSDEVVYSLNKIKEKFKIQPIRNGLIAYQINDFWMNFYVLSESASYNGETELDLIFMGSGTLDSLRELRHSYFESYVFYLNLDLMIDAMKWLKLHFD